MLRQRWMFVLVALLGAGCSQDDGGAEVVSSEDAGEPGMILVPAGEFVMGSNKTDEKGIQQEYGFTRPLYLDEHPEHRRSLGAFWIDVYEVTNKSYKEFVDATNYTEPAYWIQNGYNVKEGRLRSFAAERLKEIAVDYFQVDKNLDALSGAEVLRELVEIQAYRDTLPVTSISWYDAYSYCRWRDKRLPSEAEWEKAARGQSGQEFAWGNEWDIRKANIIEGDDLYDGVLPVGSYASDRSPYGVMDMGGNVSEWVNDWYQAYSGNQFESEFFGEVHKIVKGGGAGVGHYSLSVFFRGARRSHGDPATMSTDVGFRCAKDVKEAK